MLGIRSPARSQSRETGRDVYSKRREEEAAAKTPGSADSSGLHMSPQRRPAFARATCRTSFQQHARGPGHVVGVSAASLLPPGKGGHETKNKYSFQRPPQPRTRCYVAWRRHLQEEICQPESNKGVDVSGRGLRLARSHPDLLNQVLPANVDLHKGSTKLLQYNTSSLMYRDLLWSQRDGPHRTHLSWEITPWCCHQSLYGDQAGCSTCRAESVRASTCLNPAESSPAQRS